MYTTACFEAFIVIIISIFIFFTVGVVLLELGL